MLFVFVPIIQTYYSNNKPFFLMKNQFPLKAVTFIDLSCRNHIFFNNIPASNLIKFLSFTWHIANTTDNEAELYMFWGGSVIARYDIQLCWFGNIICSLCYASLQPEMNRVPKTDCSSSENMIATSLKNSASTTETSVVFPF